jgi:hypothetical protein
MAAVNRGCAPLIIYAVASLQAILAAANVIPTFHGHIAAVAVLVNILTVPAMLSMSRMCLPYPVGYVLLLVAALGSTVTAVVHVIADHRDLVLGVWDYIANGGAGSTLVAEPGMECRVPIGPLVYISVMAEIALVVILWTFLCTRKHPFSV